MSADVPFASVLVRARNDEALVGCTLEGVFSQKADFPFEVVVCDDASTDRTREIAAKFPVRFFERPAGPYKPGRTLNALVRDARGEVVVFNNSDAVPLDDRWLAELVKPLRKYAQSGEINTKTATPPAEILRKIKEAYSQKARVFELDGVSVDAWDSEGYWANVRMSNTEPLVRLNLEGKTMEIMEAKRDEYLSIIRA